jgi:Fimbrial assembly protein (PilN)
MKVYLNLAVAPSRRERYALAWSAPTLVVALIVFVYLASSAVRGFRHWREIGRSLTSVQANDAHLLAEETELRLELGRPKYRQMINETEFVNQLISQRQFSLTGLTIKVSRLLPSDVRLNGLGLAGSDSNPEVQFAVMAKNEKAVETFLSNLEDSKDFSDVTIKNQGFQGGPGGSPEQVALICTARYITGFSPAAP